MEKINLEAQLVSYLKKIEKFITKSSAASLHDARKNLKKFRALIRLIRYSINSQSYDFLNITARDIARTLAESRDLDSAIEACERNYPKLTSYQKNLTTRLRKKIIKYKKKKKDKANQSENLQKVSEMKSLIAQLQISDISDAEILLAYRKMYKKTKQYLNFLLVGDELFYFHEWRKKVKYLRYQTAFFQEFWLDYYAWYENQLHILSDLLGNMQDNELLNHYIKEYNFLVGQGAEKYKLKMAELNQILKESSIKTARLILSERPNAILHKLEIALNSELVEENMGEIR